MLTGVQIAWVQDYYDEPLAGHAWYNKRYGKFLLANGERRRGPARYAFYEAKGDTVLRLFAHRQLFEDMVGHHWTYRNGGRGVSAGFDPAFAIDFAGYYGRGTEVHPYRALTGKPMEDGDFEYVGDFYREPAKAEAA
jgi:hypothetical protein